MLESLCTALGINKGAFLPGLLGGVFSLRWVPQCGWFGISSAIMFAGLTANYLTEPVYLRLGVTGLHQGGVGMMIGLFATSTTAAVFKALQELQLGPILTEAARNITNRFTGGKP